MTLTRRRPQKQRQERLSFEALLADLSARFVNVPSEKLDDEIVDAQRRICDCLGLDASSLWQSEVENPSVHVLTHAFRPGQAPPIPERMEAQEYFPWCRQQLLAGKAIIVSSLEKLPPEAARDIESWRYFGVKTSLTFPLSAGGGPTLGSLSFNDLRRERLWPAAIVNRLQLVAQIFASALARRRADEILRENEQRFRGLAESALVGIYVLENGRYTYVNPAMARVFGYSVSEMTGMTPREIVQSCDHAMVCENIHRRITGQVRAMQYEVRGRHKDGSTRDVEVYGTTVVTQRGPTLVGTLIDITDRKRAEMALRQSGELNRSIFEQAAVGIAQVGLEGRWLRVNDKLCEILGYSREDLMQLTFQDITCPEDLDSNLNFLRQAMSGDIKTCSMEKRYIRKDKSLVWANVTVALVRNEFPQYFITVVEDITGRKQAELELHELSGRLITAQEKERAWLAKELHDGLSQNLALLAIDLDQLGKHPPEKPTQVSARMEKLSTRVKELAEDVHQLSHGLHPSVLETLGLVTALKGFCRELEHSKKLAIRLITCDVPQMLPNELALCLYRVAQEALQNVVKHSGAKQATVEINVAGGEIHMRIADNGKGFDLHSNTITDSIGLIGMRERIGLLHGQIRWETKPGHGTTVQVRVPI